MRPGAALLVEYEKTHPKLDPMLARWYAYPEDAAHSIECVLRVHADQAFKAGGDPAEYLIPVPVRAVLRGYTVERGYVIANLEYDPAFGLVTDEGDSEYLETGGVVSASIEISNDGQKITATNYWQSDYARAGALYISVNAGAVRRPPATRE